METKVQNKLEYINSLKAVSFMDDEQLVRPAFISLYKSTHPGETDEQAKIFYERESHFLKRIIVANPKLAQATTFSLYCCFIDIITNGMTFEPAAGLLYIETRGYNISPYGQAKVWENRANNKLSAAGELNLRMQLGQIKYADTPVIVYDGDLFKIGTSADGKKYVVWEATVPRKDKARVIASFVKITRPDGSFDLVYLTETDFTRFSAASEKQNSYGNQEGKANELYKSFNGGIDPGFAATKTMRHAFRAFPKAKILGSNTMLEDDGYSENAMVFDRGNVDNQQPAGQQQQPATSQPPASTWSDQQPSLQQQPATTVVTGNETKKGEGVQFNDINF